MVFSAHSYDETALLDEHLSVRNPAAKDSMAIANAIIADTAILIFLSFNFHTSLLFVEYPQYLKGYRHFEISQIYSRGLFNFIQPVNQRISVHVQLSRGFGYVHSVFEKTVDGKHKVAVLEYPCEIFHIVARNKLFALRLVQAS